MAHWLMKSEPESYGWADLVRDGGTEWDGVRNNAARLHLKAMKRGDEAEGCEPRDSDEIGEGEFTEARPKRHLASLAFGACGEGALHKDKVGAPVAEAKNGTESEDDTDDVERSLI